MSCTSPLTVASTIVPLVGALGLLHVRLEVADRGLHRLGRLQHLGDDHLVGVEEPADLVHAGHQRAVDDLERPAPPAAPRRDRRRALPWSPRGCSAPGARRAAGSSQSSTVCLRRCGRGSAPRRRRSGRRRATRSGPRRAARSSSGIDGVALELLGVDDRHVEAGLHAVVEEDRVQHLAAGRRQAEGDVGDAEDGLAARQLLLDQADALDRLDAGADVVLVAGADREDQRVEEDVLRRDAVLLGQQLVRALRRWRACARA